MNQVIFGLLLLTVVTATATADNFAETFKHEEGNGTDAWETATFSAAKPDQCYQCTSPCSAYACCPGSHPQCCYVSGLGCGCCTR